MDCDRVRRRFLAAGATSIAASAAGALNASATPFSPAPPPPPSQTPLPASGDETFWAAIAAEYDLPKDVLQLENGNWGVMARPVLEAYEAETRRVNRDGSFYSRRLYADDYAAIRARVAQALGVVSDEIVFTRGATEALQALIGGYSGLKPGDSVLLADLDYDAMQTAMRWLKVRRGVDVVEIAIPEPATYEGVIEAYARALDANRRIRLMLLTHVSHRTGLVLPVRDIVALARARGVDVIVDSAHAWGQLDFRLPEIGADFVGLNMHKWMGAPLGVGLMYIRRERIAAIEPFMGEPDAGEPSIDARVHTGTLNMAAILAVPAALDFHNRIGSSAKEARLRQLRSRWTERLRGRREMDVLTPADPRLHAAITSFRLANATRFAENVSIASKLLLEHKIFTVARGGAARGACVRVTPGLFTRMEDMDRLSTALESLIAR